MALCATLGAMAYTITGYREAPMARLRVPAQPDSVESENKFEATQLLHSRHLAGQWPDDSKWKPLLTDSTGMVGGSKSTDAPELRTYTTRLRAARYSKGTLKLTTASLAEVSVNGEALVSHESSDSTAKPTTAPLELLPEADMQITVNILTMPDDKGPAGFKLEFAPDAEYKDVSLKSGADLRRRVSPVATMQGDRVTGVSLSPDGKYLLTRYRETVSATETRRRAMLTETATGRVISEDINQSAEWMPRGNRLYFTRAGVKGYDLYTLSVPGMRSQRIATAIPSDEITVSPDEQYLIYYTNVEGAKETGVMRRVRTPDDRIPGDRDRYYLSRYDLETGVSTVLTYGGATTQFCDMTRDGSKLLYISSRATPDKYPFYRSSLIQMDMRTFATDTIVTTSNADSGVNDAVYSPDGRQVFLTGGPDALGGIGANYAPEPIGNDFDRQGFIMDIATRRVRAMTRDFDPSIEGSVTWNPVNNMIYFIGERGFFRDLYELNPGSGVIRMLAKEVETVRGFSIGDNEERLVAYYGGGFTNEGAAWLLDLKNGRNTLVDDPLKQYLGDMQFGEMRPWSFTASDGSLIDGYMCLPPDFDPQRKYPLIVYYYGGTSPTSAGFYHLYSPQVFASRDYVVYTLNPSGTTGYGQEFSARHVNAWGKRTADEIIEGVKAFCKAHPYVDDKKIGCLGASYGGFMTQYLLTKTDIFAAAMSHAGISNVTSYWGEGYWGYSYNSVAAAKSYPWTDPELYTKQGSLFNADKIHTPLLLLHGTADTNVPIGESIQLFNALRILGRDVEFITVEGENHVISDYEKKLLWQNTIMAWFAKWLQDDPRWWNSLYGNK